VAKIRSQKNWFTWLTIFLLIPSLLLNIFLYSQNKKLEKGTKVIEVLDGDTVLLDGDVRLRLRHIDAPELQFCGGQEAKKVLTDLVKDKKITIQEQILDQYGRPMALIFTGNVLVNQKMLESGWARYHSDSTTKTSILKKAADLVREKKLGIYSALCYQKENPDNPDCNIKGNIDKNSDKRKYYYPGCAQYNFTVVEKDIGENWFCTKEKAEKAGFTKADTCN
jgi:micrococcal nuclease